MLGAERMTNDIRCVSVMDRSVRWAARDDIEWLLIRVRLNDALRLRDSRERFNKHNNMTKTYHFGQMRLANLGAL